MPQKIKNILFIITQFEYGGAQRFVHTLVTHLDPKRYDITVAFGSSGSEAFLEKELAAQGVKTRRVRHLVRNPNPYHDIASIFEIRRLIKELAPDTLFLASSKAGFVGSLAASFKLQAPRPKVIYRIGGWSFNDPRPRWQRWVLILFEKIAARWKDVIILNNQHDYNQAMKLGIRPRDSLALIHNGLDAYKTNYLARDEARLQLFKKITAPPADLFQSELIIGTIANFYPTKGLEHLIEAMRLLSFMLQATSYKLFLIGDGAQRSMLEQKIREYKLERTIMLTGQVPNAAQFMKAFDMFVLPSVKEGFPWVVLEAMAAKVPVIATRVGAIPEIIDDGKNGFIVEPSNPQQLADRIHELTTNDRVRQEFGIQGHQTVLFKFGLDRMITELEKLL